MFTNKTETYLLIRHRCKEACVQKDFHLRQEVRQSHKRNAAINFVVKADPCLVIENIWVVTLTVLLVLWWTYLVLDYEVLDQVFRIDSRKV